MVAKACRASLVCLMACTLLTFLSVQRLNAQVLYGSLVGTVTDQTDAVVPGAKVTITNKATGLKREAIADTGGVYSVIDIPPGVYNLTATASGFKPLTKTNVEVTVNTVSRIDAQLQVGAITQEVTVQATAAVLQTENADVHTQLSSVAIENLPLNQYRNFQTLIDLVPGATPGEFQNAIADTPERALSHNINGTARNNNNTRVDGAVKP